MSGGDSTGVIPATSVRATDEVIDAIADIEMHRQEMEKESGLTESCGLALRKLHEVLEREKEVLQHRGPEAGHPENIAAITIEIERVKGLAVTTGRGPTAGSAYPERQKASWQNARRSPARNKGRRTMGRGGGR